MITMRNLKMLSGALLLAAALPVLAQGFPSRPVRLVVPYPPGGANDIGARLVAPTMIQQLGQNVIVDNRGGGNTLIGSEIVARSAPNGYTLLVVAAGHAINPALYPKLPFDAQRDFMPVPQFGDGAYVFVAHPGAGVSTSAELIALAKSKPGQVSYASSSTGNLTHLADGTVQLAGRHQDAACAVQGPPNGVRIPPASTTSTSVIGIVSRPRGF